MALEDHLFDHFEELARTDWGPDVYLSPGDAGRFFACAVEAPADLRFAVVYACSRPVRAEVYDLQPAKKLLGYEPRVTLEKGLTELMAWLDGQTAEDKVEQARQELSARGLTV